MVSSVMTSNTELGRLFLDYYDLIRQKIHAERQNLFRNIVHIEVTVLDAFSALASSVPVVADHCECMIKILKDCLSGAASDELMTDFCQHYKEIETLIFPASIEVIKHKHGMQGLTHNLSLMSIDVNQLRAMEMNGHRDPDMKNFMNMISRRLKQVKSVEDVIGYSQVFEIYGEALVYSILKQYFSTKRIKETGSPTPDFQCNWNGKTFYVEVKSFDIVEGEFRHKEITTNGLAANLELEEQIKSGKKVSIVESVFAPYKKSKEDKYYDPRSLILVIDTIRDKARKAFKETQFALGPTLAVVVGSRLLIPGGSQSVIPYYYEPLLDDGAVVSGVLWHTCFGKSGSAIFRHPDFGGDATLEGYLTESGLYSDDALPFPGAAFIVVDVDFTKIGIYGLFDGSHFSRGSWSSCDTEEVLARFCTIYNDKGNS